MNTLLFALVRALRTHRWLRLLLCAFVLSSLGNGLTQVLVFGQLLRWHASPSTLTLAYLLATLPGFVGSLAGEKLCRRLSPLSLLIITELLGMVALALPLFGLMYHSIPALLMVQSAEALLGGMSWPALALVFKRGLTHEELPAATGMESVIFASQVLLGTGVGVLLFDHVAPLILLSIDALSFLASVALLMLTRAHYRARDMSNRNNGQPLSTIAWPSLTAAQKRSLLILPALAAVGSPAMALLPALAQQIHPDDASGLALPLLFARSLGQLCGPLLLNGEKLPHYARRNRLLVLCLAIFLGAYGLLPLLSEEKSAALGLIFIAHLASNVVFAAGTFSLLAGFSGDEIPAASAKAWRWQTLTATLMTTIAAWLASEWGAAQALYSVSLSALLLMSVVMARYRE
ncbi:MFS transporter [Phytobacter sp. RSE-02]|uniref:MFS transporter n=1 Tax=Phytobacter sp. RSE-02 TaxID=3229229 RepID=UPI00339D69E5